MLSCPVLRNESLPGNPLVEKNCPCPRECPRHGNCFECLANHRDNMKILPHCLRLKLGEIED